jgi:hypothetical protein
MTPNLIAITMILIMRKQQIPKGRQQFPKTILLQRKASQQKAKVTQQKVKLRQQYPKDKLYILLILRTN